MARPREFEREEALLKALELFWECGYEATTMTRLQKAMGIGRQSLYDTFGDKPQIFSEALARYIGWNNADIAKRLSGTTGVSSIRSLLNARVQMLSSRGQMGCLLINSCVELCSGNSEVTQQIQNGLTELTTGFEQALEDAVQQDEITPPESIPDLANFLTAQVAGMVVMAKNGAGKAQLQAIADLTMDTLTRD